MVQGRGRNWKVDAKANYSLSLSEYGMIPSREGSDRGRSILVGTQNEEVLASETRNEACPAISHRNNIVEQSSCPAPIVVLLYCVLHENKTYTRARALGGEKLPPFSGLATALFLFPASSDMHERSSSARIRFCLEKTVWSALLACLSTMTENGHRVLSVSGNDLLPAAAKHS